MADNSRGKTAIVLSIFAAIISAASLLLAFCTFKSDREVRYLIRQSEVVQRFVAAEVACHAASGDVDQLLRDVDPACDELRSNIEDLSANISTLLEDLKVQRERAQALTVSDGYEALEQYLRKADDALLRLPYFRELLVGVRTKCAAYIQQSPPVAD